MVIKFLKRNFFLLLLVVIIVFICFKNYQPHTFLSGWDTLHPEFNFGLNFSRLLSVWHYEQGLGAIPGHSTMADIPRLVILWVLSLIFPLSSLRYLYIFICLFLGPIGMYFLILKLTDKKFPYSQLIAFVSALFYLLNLSTLQQFYVPFEMFTTQYGFLPWIILFSLKFLEDGGKKNLIIFSLITLLATPQAYAAQLWYAFFIVFLLFLISYTLFHLKQHRIIAKMLTLLLVTLIINSYWLLPNLYYIKTSSSIPQQSKQNRLYSQEYQLRNRENGYLKDVALVKGFYFNWDIYDFQKDKPTPLLQDWNNYLSNGPLTIGYGLFIFSTIGLFLAFFRKNKVYASFWPFFLISFVFLMNHTFPFNRFFDLLIRLPLFNESLRFVFTKFSILLIFSYVIFFSQTLSFIFSLLKNRLTTRLTTGLITICLITFTLPMFQGKLISNRLKIKIPDEYFSFWKMMKDKPQGTVLTLPLYNFSGWQYYNWGYQGSGFLWFGLKQPVLDRDSDRWSSTNEQAFKEFSYALYSRNPSLFTQNLKKFNIRYIVWDKSVTTTEPKNKDQILFKRETTDFLSKLTQLNIISKLALFNNISVYEVIIEVKPQSIEQLLPAITPEYHWQYYDSAYTIFGPYFTSKAGSTFYQKSIYFPYRKLISISEKIEKASVEKLSKLNPIIIDNTFQLLPGKTYLLDINSRNFKGIPLRFCLKNMYSNICDLYDELSADNQPHDDYFLIPPIQEPTYYQLTINNVTYDNYETKNEFKKVSIIPIKTDIYNSYIDNRKIDQLNTVLVFYQSYHPGWAAFIDGQLLKNHVLVNNWANGWIIKSQIPNSKSQTNIVVLFWPQYLEYAGFVAIIIFLILVLKNRNPV